MFNKNAFATWWTATNLKRINLNTLSIDQAELSVEPYRDSLHWIFCKGLMLGDKTAHLTITPSKENETFEYFHFTLDQPEVRYHKGENIRCDHVFLETDEIGDVRVVGKLCDKEGNSAQASSKSGLTHNADFLKDMILWDLNMIMGSASVVVMPDQWTIDDRPPVSRDQLGANGREKKQSGKRS
jgi:hypothetical protein